MNWLTCKNCEKNFVSNYPITHYCDECVKNMTLTVLVTENSTTSITGISTNKSVTLAKDSPYEVDVDMKSSPNEKNETLVFRALIEEIQQLKARVEKLEKT